MKFTSLLFLAQMGSVVVQGHYVRTKSTKPRARARSSRRSPRASSFDYDTPRSASSFDFDERSASSFDFDERYAHYETTPRSGGETNVEGHISRFHDLPQACHELESGMAYIEEHSWNEDTFSSLDYESARPFLELVKEDIYANLPKEEADKFLADLDQFDESILRTVFSQIDKDPSQRDANDDEEAHRRLILSNWDSIEDYETAVAHVHYYLSIFPHEEIGEMARQLDKLDMRHFYYNETFSIEAMQEFLKENGVSMFEDHGGRFLAENVDEGLEAYLEERGLRMLGANCSKEALGLIASFVAIAIAAVGVATNAANKVAEKLSVAILQKVGWKTVTSLLKTLATDFGPGTIVNTISGLLIDPLEWETLWEAIKSSMSGWTLLWTGVGIAAQIVAMFFTAGTSLALKAVSLFAGIIDAIRAFASMIGTCEEESNGGN